MAAADPQHITMVLVRGGLSRVKEIEPLFIKALGEYNKAVYRLGYYLKPKHVVLKTRGGRRVRYVYYGRYWWRVEYGGRKGGTSRIKWRYIGVRKPDEVPPPPPMPLEGLKFIVVGGDDIVMSYETFERFRWLFEGLKVVVV